MASQIVEIVSNEAKKRNAKKILEVHLVIGQLNFIGKEQLKFSYKILTEKTLLESSKLVIREEEANVECDSCGYEGPLNFEGAQTFHLMIPTLVCPKCGKIVEIIKGKEFFIKSVKMVS